MPSPAQGLKELHELHTNYHKVQEKLEKGPRLLKAKKALVSQKQQEADDVKAKLLQTKMEYDSKSLNLKAQEAKLNELRQKLHNANSTRDYDALSMQIEADKAAVAVMETEALDAMQRHEAVAKLLVKVEEELAAAKNEEQKQSKLNQDTESKLRPEAIRLSEMVRGAEAAVNLPEEVASVYRRLVAAHGAGALAPFDGTMCTFCYVNIPTQTGLTIRQGKFVFCRSCGRLLYFSPES